MIILNKNNIMKAKNYFFSYIIRNNKYQLIIIIIYNR